jgi:hypothetical protein
VVLIIQMAQRESKIIVIGSDEFLDAMYWDTIV